MKIVIIGCGRIGKTVLHNLIQEGHTITIIDENKDTIETLIEKYDVMGIVGNGASLEIQNEAKVKNADLVIALSFSDELNILACLVANKLGAKNTIARVRNPEYRQQVQDMKEELGLSLVVNPEKETAEEIFNIINLPSVNKIEHFAKGRVNLIQLTIEKDSILANETLSSLNKKIQSKVLICAVIRNEEVTIPNGTFMLKAGDEIHITADAESLGEFLREVNLVKEPLKKIIIVGGSKIAHYLAEKLSSKRYKVKLIENDKKRAEELAELLPKVTIVNGDGTNHDLLTEVGIESCDAFVSLTGIDEENIIVSMYANKVKVRKTITKVNRENLMSMVKDLGITNTISPQNTVASKVISYVRAVTNKRGSNIKTLYRLVDNKVEALEFVAKKKGSFFDKPLKDLKIKKDCLVACIIRDNEVIIPNGMSTIKLNDNVIVITTHKNFDDLTDIFD